MVNEIGAALQIPDSVFAQITKAEERIKRLEQTARDSSDKINKAFMSLGEVGLANFLKRLKETQTEIGKFDVSKILSGAQGMANVSAEAGAAAASVTQAAVAMNQMGERTYSTTKNLAELTAERKKLTKELTKGEGLSLAGGEQQKAVNSLEAVNRAIKEQKKGVIELTAEQTKLKNSTYEGALAFSAGANNITKRTEAIKYLTAARAQLSTTDANYAQKLKALNDAIKRMNAENNKAVEGSKQLQKQHNNLMNTSEQLARKLALIFSVSQITGYIKTLARVRGEFELQNTALASILQNKDQADKLFGQITELAVKSPFTLKELTTYTKSLSAYQVEYEKLYDTTKMLADVSAGLSVDMQRLILAFGQVKAANFLRGTETRQFTEAGLNILGELAKYYSDLEGRIVSVGEVQERQFKRMIKFQDVEAVFKRLTSEGNMFYQMQEKQAETLAGQMSNLQDSVDIMLNSIGKSNEGVLKGTINVIREIVENWQVFATLIEASSVGLAVYTVKTIAAAVATRSLSAASAEAAASTSGLNKILLKSAAGMKSLFAWMAANPLTLTATAIAAVGISIYNHAQKVEEAKKEYDVFTRSLESSKAKLMDLKKQLDANNKAISENQNIIKNTQSGTSAYLTAQENLNKEQKKQETILDALKSKYPEIHEQIVRQKDGTVDMTEALKDYNAELERSQYLNYLAKSGETFFDDGIKNNIKDATEAQFEYQKALGEMDNAWKVAVAGIKEYMALNRNMPTGLQKSLNLIINSTKDSKTNLEQLYKLAKDMPKLFEISGGATTALSDYYDAADKLRDANNQLKKDIEEIGKTYRYTYNTNTEEGKRLARNATQNFLKELEIQNEAVSNFVKRRFEVSIGVSLDWGKGKKMDESLSLVQKGINDFIKRKNLKIDLIKFNEDPDDYFKKLNENLQKLTAEAEQFSLATENLSNDPNKTNKQLRAEKLEEIRQTELLLKAYGALDKKRTKTDNSANKRQQEALRLLKERIELLKKAGDTYEEFLKYYDKETAKQKTRDYLKDAAKDLKIQDIVMTMDFDISGVISAISSIKNTVGEEGAKVLREAQNELTKEKEIKFKEEGLDAIQEKMDKLFSSYDFNLELQTSGVDTNAMRNFLKDLGATDDTMMQFGLDTTTLEELQKKVRAEMARLQQEGGEDSIKYAKQLQEKLTVIEMAAAQKKYDELMRLREKYQTNEDKIAKEKTRLQGLEAEKAAIEAGFKQVSEEQKELIDYQIKESNDMIRQLESEALQLTDFWKQLFGDLENLSVSSLRRLVRMSDEVLTNAKKVIEDGELKGYQSSYIDKDGNKKDVTLTIEQYQRLLKKSSEVSNQIADKNPFIALYDAAKDGRKEGETTLDYIERLKNYMDGAIEVAAQLADNLATIFGADEDAKQSLENIMSTVKGVEEFGTGIAQMASGTPEGIISGIMNASSGMAKIVSSINSIFDSGKEKEIERQLELVEDLQRAYEKLEEAIDSAYTIDTYNASYENAISNLEKQNEALQKAINAERDKKDTDDDRIKEWQQQMEDNMEQIQELQEQYINSLGGFGSEANVKSAAEEFAEAWLDAFMETGDGLDALKDKWNEYIQNVVAKQLMLKGTDKYLADVMNLLDKQLEDGQFTQQEASEIQDKIDEVMPLLNEYWKAIAGSFELPTQTETGELSGLQKGIESITEETAQALESLLNSIRYFVADTNAQVNNLYRFFTGTPEESPLMQELRMQTRYLGNINTLVASVIKTTTGKGKVLRVELV